MIDLALEWYQDSEREVELDWLDCKFVCAEKDGRFKLVLEEKKRSRKRRIANHSTITEFLWKEGFSVRGGGFMSIYRGVVDIEWGSESMKVRNGWDRPRDEKEANQLLDSLKEALDKHVEGT